MVYLSIIIFQFVSLDPNNFIPSIIKLYVMSIAFTILILLLSLRYIKISIHMCALGSLLALLFMYYKDQIGFSPYLIPAWFIISGIVGTSRLILESHQPKEIYLGFLLGFISTFSFTLFS